VTISVPSWTFVRSGEAAGREPDERRERIGALVLTDHRTVTEP
jgi:hypothetical protein